MGAESVGKAWEAGESLRKELTPEAPTRALCGEVAGFISRQKMQGESDLKSSTLLIGSLAKSV